MRADEPPFAQPGDRVAALRTVIESGLRDAGPDPVFSSDGGVTVFDDYGRSARLQPLGQRIRVSLTSEEGLDAEAEVDADTLVADIAEHGSTYSAILAALDHENGPGGRSW
ncbi:hypothetical protein [Actinomycetospora sp.]|jgi:hypothetical protein|uniref:hypothetical protein n=1 Tax=Actinomycetospora sp. TaxID=1872135 RepID=UPI002F4003A8